MKPRHVSLPVPNDARGQHYACASRSRKTHLVWLSFLEDEEEYRDSLQSSVDVV